MATLAEQMAKAGIKPPTGDKRLTRERIADDPVLTLLVDLPKEGDRRVRVNRVARRLAGRKWYDLKPEAHAKYIRLAEHMLDTITECLREELREGNPRQRRSRAA